MLHWASQLLLYMCTLSPPSSPASFFLSLPFPSHSLLCPKPPNPSQSFQLSIIVIAASDMKFPPPSLQLMHPSSIFRQPAHPIIQFPSTQIPSYCCLTQLFPMPNSQCPIDRSPISNFFYHGPSREYQDHPGYTGPKKQFANLRLKKKKTLVKKWWWRECNRQKGNMKRTLFRWVCASFRHAQRRLEAARYLHTRPCYMHPAPNQKMTQEKERLQDPPI